MDKTAPVATTDSPVIEAVGSIQSPSRPAKPAIADAGGGGGGDLQLDLYSFPFENLVFEGGSNNVLAYIGAVRVG